MLKQPFDDLMDRRARIAGWIYLPIHVIVLPLLLGVVLYLITGKEPDDVWTNVIYYGIGFVVILATMWNYLRLSFHRLTDDIVRFFGVLACAYAVELVLSSLFMAATQLFGELPSPNQEMVGELAGKDYKHMMAMAVLLAPIVEETLFRGVIFGSCAKKSRVLAYVVSILAFSLYHVWQYAVVMQDWTMLLGAIQYIPISAALCFCYDRSSTIWTPIFFHMFNNALAMSMM